MHNTESSYEDIPYFSKAYSQSSPNNLATLGTLFGMSTTPISESKILELGCSDGCNIIPHAINNPNSHYIGIDKSNKHIEHGMQHIKKLSLTNIKLLNASILDIDKSYGKFDYIICHGVLSWVPEHIRKKIFKIFKNHLSKNGIAYVSYNTLPGWNMVRSVRDMMNYHTKEINDEKEKISQSHAILNFVKDSISDQDSSYAKLINSELKILNNTSNSYLRHDHLEDNNKSYYFHEFMACANKEKLQYLSDASISSMYLGNMNTKVINSLKDVKDIVKLEQYMDFIRNRRFRSTLLCHDDIKLNRNVNSNDISKFTLTCNVVRKYSEKSIDTDSDKKVKFYFNFNTDVYTETSNPILKSILSVMVESSGYPITIDTISQRASKCLKDQNPSDIKGFLNKEIMSWVFNNTSDTFKQL